MVYIWISVKTGEYYIGSTKMTIFERARAHLGEVRKLQKFWEKRRLKMRE